MSSFEPDVEKGPGLPASPVTPASRYAIMGRKRSVEFQEAPWRQGATVAAHREKLRDAVEQGRITKLKIGSEHPGRPRKDSHATGPGTTPFSSHSQLRAITPDSAFSTVSSDESYGDTSGKMWTLFLSKADKHDKEVLDAWKGDMKGILNFAGLFSVVVAVFLVMSYAKLSANTGDQTVLLLAQISQQLAGVSNGTSFPPAISPATQHFSPSSSTVRVTILWSLSLVLSIACALSATLMQQWSRRYQQLMQTRGTPHQRGRVRAFLFNGIARSRIAYVFDTIATMLHASVWLFLAGLVDYLLPLNKPLAYAVLGVEVGLALAYAAVTFAPNVFLDCPYSTPLSGGVWRASHAIALVGLHILSVFAGSLRSAARMHEQQLADGLRGTVLQCAADAPPRIDRNALEWTLKELHEDRELEAFVARLPGFFDSRAVRDADETVLALLAPRKDGADPVLGVHLHNLLRTCLADDLGVDAKTRRRRLLVSLRAVWYCARAYAHTGTAREMPDYVRARFAEPNLVNALWGHRDQHVRIVARCIGALFALRLIWDIRARTGSGMSAVDPAEAASLLKLTQQSSGDFDGMMLQRLGPAELINIVSFAKGILAITNGRKLPSKTLNIVSETFAALGAGLSVSELDVPLETEQETRSFFIDKQQSLKSLGEIDGLQDLMRKLHVLSEQLPHLAEEAEEYRYQAQRDSLISQLPQSNGQTPEPIEERQESVRDSVSSPDRASRYQRRWNIRAEESPASGTPRA
ncbi:hypothetical protein BC834DRAFT_144969 [Gloeopeniophorella convolvens]|nr:hypothetical protein BC834DRAFT_144969 [Gloeopeniophorella convolvens]